MAYQRQTLEFNSLAADLIPADAPLEAWNQAENVVFKNGETRRASGEAAVMGVPLTAPHAMCYYQNASFEGFWIYAGLGGVFYTQGGVHGDLTPAEFATKPPSDQTIWSLFSFNGLVILNTSTGSPHYWTGNPGAPFAILPDWPVDGRAWKMRGFKSFLVALGMLTESGSQRVRWSDAAEAGEIPDSWTPAADNFAGFADLAPFDSPVVDAAVLRDQLIVFKGETVHSFDFIGGNDVFAIRTVFAGVGMCSPDAFALSGDERLLFAGTDGDVYQTDGVEFRSVIDGTNQRTYFGELNTARWGRVFGVTLSRTNQTLLCYPSQDTGPATRALVIDWESGRVSFRQVSDVWCGASGAILDIGDLGEAWDDQVLNWSQNSNSWNKQFAAKSIDDVVLGGNQPALIGIGRGSDYLTGPVQATLTKTGLSFGDAQARKLVSRAWPKFRGEAGQVIRFRFGGQEAPEGPITLTGVMNYAIGQTAPLDFFVQGRYIAVIVESQNGAPWALGTIDLEYKGAGKW